MEAQVPPSSVATGVSGPLRGIPRPGGTELVADPSDGADGGQPSANQLHLDAKPHSRRARLVAADRGDAAGALPSDPVRPVLDHGAQQRAAESSVGLEEIRHHVHLLSRPQQHHNHHRPPPQQSQSTAATIPFASVPSQAAHEILGSPLHGRDHVGQQQAEAGEEAEEGGYLPLDIQELRDHIARNPWPRGEKALPEGGEGGWRLPREDLPAHDSVPEVRRAEQDQQLVGETIDAGVAAHFRRGGEFEGAGRAFEPVHQGSESIEDQIVEEARERVRVWTG